MKWQLPGKLQFYILSQSALIMGNFEYYVGEEEHNFILSRVPYNCRADTEPSPTHMLLHIFTVGCLKVSNFNYLESTVNAKLPEFFLFIMNSRGYISIFLILKTLILSFGALLLHTHPPSHILISSESA